MTWLGLVWYIQEMPDARFSLIDVSSLTAIPVPSLHTAIRRGHVKPARRGTNHDGGHQFTESQVLGLALARFARKRGTSHAGSLSLYEWVRHQHMTGLRDIVDDGRRWLFVVGSVVIPVVMRDNDLTSDDPRAVEFRRTLEQASTFSTAIPVIQIDLPRALAQFTSGLDQWKAAKAEQAKQRETNELPANAG